MAITECGMVCYLIIESRNHACIVNQIARSTFERTPIGITFHCVTTTSLRSYVDTTITSCCLYTAYVCHASLHISN